MKSKDMPKEEAELILRKVLKDMDITTLTAFMLGFSANSSFILLAQTNEIVSKEFEKFLEGLQGTQAECILESIEFMSEVSRRFYREVSNG